MYRLNDGLTTLVQNDSDTFVYGTISLGNNTAMNYGNGNAEMSIESTGILINDINSINTIQARIRVRNGGGTVWHSILTLTNCVCCTEPRNDHSWKGMIIISFKEWFCPPNIKSF